MPVSWYLGAFCRRVFHRINLPCSVLETVVPAVFRFILPRPRRVRLYRRRNTREDSWGSAEKVQRTVDLQLRRELGTAVCLQRRNRMREKRSRKNTGVTILRSLILFLLILFGLWGVGGFVAPILRAVLSIFGPVRNNPFAQTGGPIILQSLSTRDYGNTLLDLLPGMEDLSHGLMWVGTAISDLALIVQLSHLNTRTTINHHLHGFQILHDAMSDQLLQRNAAVQPLVAGSVGVVGPRMVVPELEVVVVAAIASVEPPVSTPGSSFPEDRDGQMLGMRQEGEMSVQAALGEHPSTEPAVLRDKESVVAGAAPGPLDHRGRNVPRPGPDRIPSMAAASESKCPCFQGHHHPNSSYSRAHLPHAPATWKPSMAVGGLPAEALWPWHVDVAIVGFGLRVCRARTHLRHSVQVRRARGRRCRRVDGWGRWKGRRDRNGMLPLAAAGQLRRDQPAAVIRIKRPREYLSLQLTRVQSSLHGRPSGLMKMDAGFCHFDDRCRPSSPSRYIQSPPLSPGRLARSPENP